MRNIGSSSIIYFFPSGDERLKADTSLLFLILHKIKVLEENAAFYLNLQVPLKAWLRSYASEGKFEWLSSLPEGFLVSLVTAVGCQAKSKNDIK